MRFLICNTEAEAIARSEQEAAARGCTGTTTHWWGWRETADGKFALLLGDESAEGSTTIEPAWPENGASLP